MIGFHVFGDDEFAAHDRPVTREGADVFVGAFRGRSIHGERFLLASLDEFGVGKDALVVPVAA
jgi:hypothetical protein